MSYFTRVLRQCQSLLPSGMPVPDDDQWSLLVHRLFSEAAARWQGVTFTLDSLGHVAATSEAPIAWGDK